MGHLGSTKTCPCLLGEVELAEGDSVFDEKCEVLGLNQQGFPEDRWCTGSILLILGPALPRERKETHLGTAPRSTGHQLQISQVLWVPLNTTH